MRSHLKKMLRPVRSHLEPKARGPTGARLHLALSRMIQRHLNQSEWVKEAEKGRKGGLKGNPEK